jgi:hypothetical protein
MLLFTINIIPFDLLILMNSHLNNSFDALTSTKMLNALSVCIMVILVTVMIFAQTYLSSMNPDNIFRIFSISQAI